MLNFFRLLSLIEGLSLLTLLFVAMPAKYQFGIDFVWPVGMTHGVLWLGYVAFSLLLSQQRNWSILRWLLALASSVLPFGFVWMETRLRRELPATAAA